MASGSARIEKWDLDDDEIASIASDDLYNNRPNRWRGPASTWRKYTHEERQTYLTLQRLEAQDLAVHLYNTHALKRRARDLDTKQDVKFIDVSRTFSSDLQVFI